MKLDIKLIRTNEELLAVDSSFKNNHPALFAIISNFLEKHVSSYIDNVDTKFYALKVNDLFFPVTVNEKEYKNSYVVSPYTSVISYSLEELWKLNNKILQTVLRCFIILMSIFVKFGNINKVVIVNNWILSTNLYPSFDVKYISYIKKYMEQMFPNHTIIFRSLNKFSNTELINEMNSHNAYFLVSRQVYMIDRDDHIKIGKRYDNKADQKILSNSDYTIVPHEKILSTDYKRIVELYNLLYLEKYSYLNPKFNENLIQMLHINCGLNMTGLRDSNGTLQGIIGTFILNDTTTAPLFGYNTKLPQIHGLYRMLTALCLQQGKEKNLNINLSSGVSGFKILRGGKPEIEYSAIFVTHLPWYRRIIWKILTIFGLKIAKPILQRYKL